MLFATTREKELSRDRNKLEYLKERIEANYDQGLMSKEELTECYKAYNEVSKTLKEMEDEYRDFQSKANKWIFAFIVGVVILFVVFA